MGQLTNNKKSS